MGSNPGYLLYSKTEKDHLKKGGTEWQEKKIQTCCIVRIYTYKFLPPSHNLMHIETNLMDLKVKKAELFLDNIKQKWPLWWACLPLAWWVLEMSQWSEYCEALSNCFLDQKSLVDFIRPFLSLLLVMQVWNRKTKDILDATGILDCTDTDRWD